MSTSSSNVKRKLSCMGIVIAKNGESVSQVLLMENGGEIVFPKGHVEPGEAHTATAIREVQEETGVNVEFEHYLGKIDQFEFYFAGEEAIKVIEVHLFLLPQIQPTTPNVGEGIARAFWCPLTDAFTTLSHADAREALTKAAARIAGAV